MATILVMLALPISSPTCDEAATKILRDLARQAVEQSFQSYVEQLFETWMREETPDQAARVERGMQKAIRAYLYSRRAVERWRGVCQ